MVGAFSGLAASGFLLNPGGLLPLISLLGLGAGLFTVGGVALMLDMTASRHAGLFVGVWTLVQAMAKGPASLVSGGLHGALIAGGALPGQAYGGVFLIEATGLLIAIIMLRRVGVQRFQREVEHFHTLVSETLD